MLTFPIHKGTVGYFKRYNLNAHKPEALRKEKNFAPLYNQAQMWCIVWSDWKEMPACGALSLATEESKPADR